MMNSLLLLGDRVLINLDSSPEFTQTASGVILPPFQSTYSSNGTPKDEISSKKYLYSGTVVQLSPLASQKLEEASTPLLPGDKVMLSRQAHSDAYQFLIDRSTLTQPFDGYVAIPYALIEAKILNNG